MDEPLKCYVKSTHSFFPYEIYENCDFSKWGIKREHAHNNGERRDKATFCGAVLCYFMYLVFLDIIENNITFEFPMTGNCNAYIYVKPIQDEQFEKLFAKGCFKGTDFLASQYKGYQLCFQWRKGNKIREKPIYISTNLKRWFYSKINSGKVYY